jgi:hypothetical protein
MHRLMDMTVQNSLLSGSSGSTGGSKNENCHQNNAHSARVSEVWWQ